MNFGSYEYLFLLALVVPLYYLLPPRGRPSLLVAASLAFYCGWNLAYGLLLLALSTAAYLAGLGISRSGKLLARRLQLAAMVLAGFGTLAYFKYTQFAIDNLNALLGLLGRPGLNLSLELILPLGISFYIFRAVGYAIDVYRGDTPPCRNLITFLAFMTFFPQLIAGPIERAGHLVPQLSRPTPFEWENLTAGAGRIAWGLFKKMVVADRLYVYMMPAILQMDKALPERAVLALLFAPIVLYADFSAYTDIALGSGRMLGLTLSPNFRFPHTADNISEMWNRWHITLTQWIKNNVFMVLGGFRRGRLLRSLGLTCLVMLLIGLWHGASWPFVLGGLVHGIALNAHFLWRLKVYGDRVPPFFRSRSWRGFSWLLTQAFWTASIFLFFVPAPGTVYKMCRVFVDKSWTGLPAGEMLVGLLIVVIFYSVHALHAQGLWSRIFQRLPVPVRAALFVLLCYLIVVFGVAPQKFIYFRF